MWAAVRMEALQVREAREVEGRESIRGDVRLALTSWGNSKQKVIFTFILPFRLLLYRPLQVAVTMALPLQTTLARLCCVAQVSINPCIPLLYPPTHSSKDETI